MFSWNFPYPSQRMPVLAKNVVATSQPLAAQAGLAMLAKGGNAVDAGLAAAITLTVVEPTVERHRLGCLRDPLGRPAPRGPERLGPLARGLDAGALRRQEGDADAGLGLGHRARLRFGVGHAFASATASCRSRTLFEAAIRYARESYMVSPITAVELGATRRPNRKSFSEFAWTFLPKDRAPHPGERFYCPQQAETLEEIAATKGESFYRGAARRAHRARERMPTTAR